MTREQAERFVEFWRRRLCPEWAVECVEGPHPDEAANDADSAIWISGDYLRAKIYLHRCIDGQPDERARQTILHELMHLSVYGLERTATAAIAPLGTEAQQIARREIDHNVERVVDRLAEMLNDVLSEAVEALSGTPRYKTTYLPADESLTDHCQWMREFGQVTDDVPAKYREAVFGEVSG